MKPNQPNLVEEQSLGGADQLVKDPQGKVIYLLVINFLWRYLEVDIFKYDPHTAGDLKDFICYAIAATITERISTEFQNEAS